MRSDSSGASERKNRAAPLAPSNYLGKIKNISRPDMMKRRPVRRNVGGPVATTKGELSCSFERGLSFFEFHNLSGHD